MNWSRCSKREPLLGSKPEAVLADEATARGKYRQLQSPQGSEDYVALVRKAHGAPPYDLVEDKRRENPRRYTAPVLVKDEKWTKVRSPEGAPPLCCAASVVAKPVR